MRRPLAGLLLVAAVAVAPAVAAKPRLDGPRTAVAGRPWTATVVGAAQRPVLSATRGGAVRRAAVSRAGPRRWRVRLTFPSAGRWTLAARIAARTYPLGTVVVRRAPPAHQLDQPFDLTFAPNGSLYVASFMGDQVFRVDVRTGALTLVASLQAARDLAFDGAGNLYAGSNTKVVRIDPRGAATTIHDDGRGIAALAAQGDTLYVAEVGDTIRRIDLRTGSVAELVGAGAGFRFIHGLEVGPNGALFVGDTGNHRVRRVDPATRAVTTVAGTGEPGFGGDGGPATASRLQNPGHLDFWPDGSLYVSDFANARIRRVAPDGTITTVVGTGVDGTSGDGGPAVRASIAGPSGVAVDAAGNLYICSVFWPAIRRVDAATGTITTLGAR